MSHPQITFCAEPPCPGCAGAGCVLCSHTGQATFCRADAGLIVQALGRNTQDPAAALQEFGAALLPKTGPLLCERCLDFAAECFTYGELVCGRCADSVIAERHDEAPDWRPRCC